MTNTQPPPRHDVTPVSRGSVVRTLLWALLVISVLANMVASFIDVPTWPHLACGLVTAACATALLVTRLRS
ncbi:hypothetical protein [Amycolatopsis jiangsuensis]|uniref:Membrane protein YdbS with pleckstrin-like domain n=1 Tax=Amycolatopsis jiangsuensis TaxID=1181879 RepID=A0A840J6U4_9PSEU|nr:hypothetical protein [Amycolatopsis jiangsuensis]MBB4689513.1 membrane protein YdbS with pleckstrin-like domain [Amycolatopsis jiangsuensis]